jgi:hypothetical protein
MDEVGGSASGIENFPKEPLGAPNTASPTRLIED